MNENDRKAQLTAEILDLFVSIVGFIPRDAVTAQTNFVREFDIIDDDLTCFMMQVKWRHKLKADQAVWENIETIEQLVDYVLTYGER